MIHISDLSSATRLRRIQEDAQEGEQPEEPEELEEPPLRQPNDVDCDWHQMGSKFTGETLGDELGFAVDFVIVETNSTGNDKGGAVSRVAMSVPSYDVNGRISNDNRGKVQVFEWIQKTDASTSYIANSEDYNITWTQLGQN